jgi:hypothetical protein
MTLADRLDATAVQWLHESVETMAKRPDWLYHYTSGDGLYGILSSGVMRGTNFAFMNDRSEFQYGVEMIRESLVSAAQGMPNSGVRRALAIAHKMLEGFPCDVYLTCFCEDADLLSQWRGYGTRDSRYCIEFDSAQLPIATGVSPLSNVLYEPQLHSTLLKRMLELYLSAIGNLDLASEAMISLAASRVAIAAVPVVTRFKDLAFREEKEWRCARISWGSDPGNLEFSASGGMMRPYQTLVASTGRLPIRRIIAGASRSNLQAVRSARLMLQRFGYPEEVEVVVSKVPLQT